MKLWAGQDVNTCAIIVAAGRGARAAQSGSGPKQYAVLAGRTILERSVAAFADHPSIDAVLVVIHPDDCALYERAVARIPHKLLPPVLGGETRQASVRAGIEALTGHTPALVLIHDAARPFVTASDIAAVVSHARATGAAIAAVPLADTLKRAGPADVIAATVPRAGLWRAATPQAFRYDLIRAAHGAAAASGREFTDDAEVAEAYGTPVALVATGPQNVKITTAEDLDLAARTAAMMETAGMETRIGQGFDVHRFTSGDHVWLCGVRIDHDASLDGHSDADVGLHALTDAILGAIGDGDIGAHFPPSDPQWKGAASHLFLADAARRVAERGGRIVNVDVTLLCEAPRIGPHRDRMRERIAQILEIGVDRVGVKATTTEQLGFTGRREGIAAMASASVLLPAQPGVATSRTV